jgi:hypothetical protein
MQSPIWSGGGHELTKSCYGIETLRDYIIFKWLYQERPPTIDEGTARALDRLAGLKI